MPPPDLSWTLVRNLGIAPVETISISFMGTLLGVAVVIVVAVSPTSTLVFVPKDSMEANRILTAPYVGFPSGVRVWRSTSCGRYRSWYGYSSGSWPRVSVLCLSTEPFDLRSGACQPLDRRTTALEGRIKLATASGASPMLDRENRESS